MFDIGWQELFVLGAVAMVIFPPREYPELLRGVVGLLHRLRRMGEDVREGIDEFSQHHLSEQFESIEGAKRSIGTSFGETQRLLRQSAENTRKQIADIEARAGKGVKRGAKKGASKSNSKSTKTSKSTATTTASPAKPTKPAKPSKLAKPTKLAKTRTPAKPTKPRPPTTPRARSSNRTT